MITKHSYKILKRKKGLKSYWIGYSTELAAIAFLALKGYRLLNWRYHTPHGEIDLVMRDGNTIVFLEIKYRPISHDAIRAVTTHQKQRILKASRYWLLSHSWAYTYSQRYDILGFGRPFQKKWILHIPAYDPPAMPHYM